VGGGGGNFRKEKKGGVQGSAHVLQQFLLFKVSTTILNALLMYGL
jgi:hypothetical protein